MKILKALKWLLKSLLISLVLLFLSNLIGVYLNFNVPINPWTIIIVGILRIPGLIALIIFMLF